MESCCFKPLYSNGFCCSIHRSTNCMIVAWYRDLLLSLALLNIQELSEMTKRELPVLGTGNLPNNATSTSLHLWELS